MHCNGPIIRPQTDADSIFIEVTVGCTHNKCTFCNFYEGYPFSVAPLKNITVADILEGCKRLEKAGVNYRMIYLGGMAGKGKGKESAHKTAEVLNELHPYYLYLNMVNVIPGTELYREKEAGLFVEEEERERLTEFITLLGEMKNEIRVFAAPNTTNFSFDIDLQSEKEYVVSEMIKIRDNMTDEQELRYKRYREARKAV